MPSLNDIMCRNTTLLIVDSGISGQAQMVVNGRRRDGSLFTFDFVRNDFQLVPVRFTQHLMDGNEIQKRDASIALFQNQTLLAALCGTAPAGTASGGINFNLGVEQDAIILDNGRLHDHRRGRDSSHSPDRTNPPTIAVPPGRRCVGYFHTHPFSYSLRPPTPSSDWNEVPGVGFPGRSSVLHFMIEGNKRIWGLLQNRRTFIVGIIRDNAFQTIDPGSNARNSCWYLPQ